MKPFVLTLRAIGTEFAMRLFLPVIVGVAGVSVVLVVVTLWLTTVNIWWWLLFVPMIILFSVVVAVGFVAFSLIRYVRPSMNTPQKQAVKQFVGKLQGVAEIAATPKFFILFRLLRSVAAPSKDSYLSTLVQNKELASEFRDLHRMFNE